jgi:hypothetical protein
MREVIPSEPSLAATVWGPIHHQGIVRNNGNFSGDAGSAACELDTVAI